jgi:hypothetical protein
MNICIHISGHHFDLAKDCRSKALEYYVKAAEYFTSEKPVRYDEGIEKLALAITCAGLYLSIHIHIYIYVYIYNYIHICIYTFI